jgi:SAM-dependent methyltransferase
MRNFYFITLFIFMGTALIGSPAAASSCSFTIATEGNELYVNNVPVTGSFIFPIKLVLQNLGIGDAEIRRWNDRTVVSLGEGYGNLVKFLIRKNIRGYAFDLWYGQKNLPTNGAGSRMQNFLEKRRPPLIRGDAFRLPFADKSIDVFLAHNFLNNLSPNQGLVVFREIIRALKPGGEIRLLGLPAGPDVAILENFLKSLDKTWDIKFGPVKYQLQFAGSEIISMNEQRLFMYRFL